MQLSEMEPRDCGKIVVISVLAGMVIYIIIMLILGVKPVSNGNQKFSDFEQSLMEKAKEIYQEKKAQGVDMTSGPCLSEDIEIDWVLDIAHNPREPIDNLPGNQCKNYLNGKAKHFIEFDPKGKLIKIK